MNIIKRLFSETVYKFIDIHDNEIVYKEYIEKEGMLIIEKNGGLEKIPTDGLKRIEV